MERRKTTVYIDADLLTAVKVIAASSGRRDYEVMEEALRLYLARPEVASDRKRLRELLDRVAERSDLGEDAGTAVAREELRAHRQTKRQSRSS